MRSHPRTLMMTFFSAVLFQACGGKQQEISVPKTAEEVISHLTPDGIYVDPNSNARRDFYVLKNQGNPEASLMELIANNTVSVWYGSWSGNIQQAVSSHARAAQDSGKTPVLVAYNIPFRDCGSYSGGGLPANQYRSWISQFASAIGSAKAIVIIEPDALALTDCLSPQALAERYDLLRYAVYSFKQSAPQTKVYLDIGHPRWLAPGEAAARLAQANIQIADGFAINTSNYYDTPMNVSYGQEIRNIVQKNFVIDTSRNGRGSIGDAAWCNPPGRGLGRLPTLQTGVEGVDAYLWIKNPGESDGSCQGGPPAGAWWRARALELARNAVLTQEF